jgi:hypothetical protein
MLESKSLGEKSRQKVPQAASRFLTKTVADDNPLNLLFPTITPHLPLDKIKALIKRKHPNWEEKFQKYKADAFFEFREGDWLNASKSHKKIFVLEVELFEINLHEFVILVALDEKPAAERCLDQLLLTKKPTYKQFFYDLKQALPLKTFDKDELRTLNIWNLDEFIMRYYQNQLTLEQKQLVASSDSELLEPILNAPDMPEVKKLAWLNFYQHHLSSMNAYDLALAELYSDGEEWIAMEKSLSRIIEREEQNRKKWYEIWRKQDSFNPYYAQALASLAHHHCYSVLGGNALEIENVLRKMRIYVNKFAEDSKNLKFYLAQIEFSANKLKKTLL